MHSKKILLVEDSPLPQMIVKADYRNSIVSWTLPIPAKTA